MIILENRLKGFRKRTERDDEGLAEGLGRLLEEAGGCVDRQFDLQEYLTRGVERVVADAVKATLRNPRESAFMLRFAGASRMASKKRLEAERRGQHIPAFLIASITSSCNLHCAGCFSRSSHATADCVPVEQLTAEEWLAVFDEADRLGISFVLLMGGEPLLRRDVIEAAGKKPDILFPVFTNGVFMDEAYFELFDECRNLLPVMSMEGEKDATDMRRGVGVYDRLMANMDECRRRGLIFGVSVTVTTANIREVSSRRFIGDLSDRGCKAVIYVEYVPVSEDSRTLAPTDEERELLRAGIGRLRRECPEMVFLSFPGDEKSSGGCIAAGRGFFHINSHGGAEPCPFSPYSDANVRDSSLSGAMNSRLFEALRNGDYLLEDHVGGCILYDKRDRVEALLTR
ncbi:MAG: radical SAM protein [Schwartzia sp.]|nr:radical SAM protein [Schwartzia sp. (in: firmicutes)]